MRRGFLLVIIAMFILISCSEGPKKEGQKTAAPSTGEVVDKYVNTLTTAKPKAQKAADAENKRNAEQDKLMKEMEK